MRVILRTTRALAASIRDDLERPHPFANERVGFLATRPAMAAPDFVVLLACHWYSVRDDHYLPSKAYGALVGSTGISAALQIAYGERVSMCHVHMHGHSGPPAFSSIDLQENHKFMPDFFKVRPAFPHAAVVLSRDSAVGLCWLAPKNEPTHIEEIGEIGAPLRSTLFR